MTSVEESSNTTDVSDDSNISEAEAVEKLVELSSQKNDDLPTYIKYLSLATQSDMKCNYFSWLKDDRFGPHVKIAIYNSAFNCVRYIAAETYLDRAQTDQDLYDYLCNHVSERNYDEFRSMIANLLELMGRLMSFDYPKKTCDKLVDIIERPEQYSRYQVRCALLTLHYTDYRFEVVQRHRDEFFRRVGQKWKTVVVDTDDEELCEEGLYFVFYRGQLKEEEYIETAEALLNKHINNQVALRIYERHLKPFLMTSAYTSLRRIRSSTELERWNELLEGLCTAAMSIEFVTSIGFQASNEIIKFCLSEKDGLHFCAKALYENPLTTVDAADIVLDIYLNPASNSQIKRYGLNAVIRLATGNYYGRNKAMLELHFKSLNSIIHKLEERYLNNVQDEVQKLRCVQALLLLSPFLRIWNEMKKTLNEAARSMAIAEGKNGYRNGAVKQLLLFIFLYLLKIPVHYPEIEWFMEQTEKTPELTEMYLCIVYYIISRLKVSEEHLQAITMSVCPLLSSTDEKTSILARVIMETIKGVCKKKCFKPPEVCFDDVSEADRVTYLGADYVFLKNVDVQRDLSINTVLCLIPKLTNFDAIEWEGSIQNYVSIILPIRTCKEHVKNSQEFKQAVDTFVTDNSQLK